MSAAASPSVAGPGAAPGFGVYLHWPFCAAKCPYCDFNSHVRHVPPDQTRYGRAFAAEIAHMAARAPGRTVTSIFLGGGTPSLMAPETVGAILAAVARHWTVAGDAEVTLEANPGSVEAERFRGYRAAGVNRVSLGVQALDDASLKALGRIHTADEALKAIAIARATFPRLSFDLIYARPGQTLASWRAELVRAVDFAVDHISAYQLTIEDGTRYADLYARGKLVLPDADLAADLYDLTRAELAARGLVGYEVSNHALPGAESRHNLLYWRGGDYAGIGPGAHGRLPQNDGRHALETAKIPEDWLARVERDGHGVVVDEVLDAEDIGQEFLLMGLRLAEGIDPAAYAARAGRTLDADKLAFLAGHGLIAPRPDGRIAATEAGFKVLNALIADLAG
jgi:oxygen-independent coproporphyrinogen-3 oxidase